VQNLFIFEAMMKKYLMVCACFFVGKLALAQKPEIQIGVQTGIAIPRGEFASGYGLYIENGYAATGYNYKVYTEVRLKNAFCIGINYLNFTNGLEAGNLYAGFNNIFTTINPVVNHKYETNAILGSLMFKGKETPLFIKGYAGFGTSKSAEITGSNTTASATLLQSTSDLSLVYGFGMGIYLPIKNKFFIEIEGDYIISSGRPGNITIINNNTKKTFQEGSISYNPTVININIGVGLFLFRE